MAEKSQNNLDKSGPIDVVKQRGIYLLISLLFLIPGIYFIVMSMMTYPTHSPVRLGIDFTGGTIVEYGFERQIHQEDIPAIRTVFDKYNYPGAVVQIQAASKEMGQAVKPETSKQTEPPAGIKSPAPPEAVQKTEAIQTESSSKIVSVVSIRSKQLQGEDATLIKQALGEQFGPITLLQKNSIGPTLASELLKNGLIALLMAYLLIVGYLTFRFQFDYAVCAIVALVHDTIVVFGFFSMMGYLFHTEVDSLFITGILTVVGFSVHDTIVVFDRLRENSRVYFTQKLPFSTIANISVNQTLARSINTSVTALLTLLALYFLGGETTRDFVLCMIMGIAFGTYSSIFVASALLTWWRERQPAGQRPAPSAA